MQKDKKKELEKLLLTLNHEEQALHSFLADLKKAKEEVEELKSRENIDSETIKRINILENEFSEENLNNKLSKFTKFVELVDKDYLTITGSSLTQIKGQAKKTSSRKFV